MSFFKTSIWMGISTAIKALLSYLLWKIIAVSTGPSGVAILEQFQNFIQISRVSVPAGINEGIIKYGSEFKDNDALKSSILSNAMYLNSFIFIIAFTTLLLFSHGISYLVFQSYDYQNMIILVGACIALFILNNFGLSMLNAEMETNKYIISTISGSLFNFILTAVLVKHYGLFGGLVGLALNQTVICILTIYLIFKAKWFNINLFLSKINMACMNKLILYSFIPLSAALIGPIASIMLTKYIINTLSWTDAGYWQAINRLSQAYLILIAMVFSFYFIPKFSSLKTKGALRAEIIKSHYYLVPLISLGILVVFVFKNQIIKIMYSTEFLSVVPLFKYQLLGDFSRLCTWILKNILVAKAMIKETIAFELFFTASHILLTLLFVHYDGLIGCAIAYAVNYFLFWIAMIIFTVNYLNKNENSYVATMDLEQIPAQ